MDKRTSKKLIHVFTKDVLPWCVDQAESVLKSKIEGKKDDLELEKIQRYEKILKGNPNANISSIPVSKEELGRKTWPKIHGIAAELPKDADSDQVKEAAKQIKNLVDEYPCIDCRKHGKKLVKDVNLEDSETREELLLKTHEFHNKVSEHVGNSLMTEKEFRNQYDL